MVRPRAIGVEAIEDTHLLVTFDDGKRGVFDVKPYIHGSWFGRLADPAYFKAVRVAGLSVEWPEGQDICPDELYENTISV